MGGFVTRVDHADTPRGHGGFASLVRSVERRWSALDPMLPAPVNLSMSTNPLLTVSDSHDVAVAAGTMRYSWYQPGETGRTWGVPDQHWLAPLVGGPDPEGAFDQLLTVWRDQLENAPGGTGEESAALLTWPARDICGVRPLRRHGMQPQTALAVRGLGRGVPPALPPRDITLRLADSQDIGAVVGLVMEEHRYEEHFGGVFIQQETAEHTRVVVARALAERPSWIWLAEQRGRPVGLVWVLPPHRARWIAPLAKPQNSAYVGYAVVAAEVRGKGIGTALISQAHHAMDAHGFAVSLLNYSVQNPLAGPFWHRMGYRPLWTTWEVRPALALR
jgi:GNAT superfamily N-acetyltransferase